MGLDLNRGCFGLYGNFFLLAKSSILSELETTGVEGMEARGKRQLWWDWSAKYVIESQIFIEKSQILVVIIKSGYII